MNEFTFSSKRVKSLSKQLKSFNYTSIKKFSSQSETIILEKEQVDLIESHPLGFACCQIYNTYIITEAKSKLIIVDQHEAHKRVIYEYLK